MPSPNDRTAFDFFVSKGLTDFQAAGVVGNLDQESGMNPTAAQATGPGRGIGQWSLGQRWSQAQAYAAQTGRDVWSLDLQLDFLWQELATIPSYGLAALRSTTNVADATIVFQDKFERCGTCNTPRRVALAESVLRAYGTTPVGMSTTGKALLFVVGGLALGAAGVLAYGAVEKRMSSRAWSSPPEHPVRHARRPRRLRRRAA